MSTLKLHEELNRFAELRRRLIEADPQIDETTLLDTLEGATNLHEAVGEVLRAALEDEALAEGLRLRLGQMKERLERLVTASARKREVAQCGHGRDGDREDPGTRLHRVPAGCPAGGDGHQ